MITSTLIYYSWMIPFFEKCAVSAFNIKTVVIISPARVDVEVLFEKLSLFWNEMRKHDFRMEFICYMLELY